jgi:hypothetical protein
MLNDLYLKVSKEMDIPVEVVEEAYKSYWKFIRHTIQELPLKNDLTEEEFAKLKTNFNIPSLGKLNCTYDKFLRIKKKLEYIKNFREKYDKCKED